MKKQHVLLFCLVSLMALASCDKISEMFGKSNLPGDWDLGTITEKVYKNGVLDTTMTQTQTGSITFVSDGTGTFSGTVEDQTQSGSFEWFEKDNKVFCTGLNIADSLMTKNIGVGFDVITNSATKQVWSVTFSQYSSEENQTTGEYEDYLMKMILEIELLKQ